MRATRETNRKNLNHHAFFEKLIPHSPKANLRANKNSVLGLPDKIHDALPFQPLPATAAKSQAGHPTRFDSISGTLAI